MFAEEECGGGARREPRGHAAALQPLWAGSAAADQRLQAEVSADRPRPEEREHAVPASRPARCVLMFRLCERRLSQNEEMRKEAGLCGPEPPDPPCSCCPSRPLGPGGTTSSEEAQEETQISAERTRLRFTEPGTVRPDRAAAGPPRPPWADLSGVRLPAEEEVQLCAEQTAAGERLQGRAAQSVRQNHLQRGETQLSAHQTPVTKTPI